MSWRKFIGKTEALVLPYFGGTSVDAEDRRLRVENELPPGWWRFDVAGRVATPVDLVEPPDLSKLPKLRGHFALGWLFPGGTGAERLELVPAEEPPVLSPVTARRWHSGAVIFSELEFESEAEDEARRALEELAPLGEIKGVGASLRAAYGFALARAVGREIGIAVSPRELHGTALAIAERGRPAAEEHLRRLQQERVLERTRIDAWLAAGGRPRQPPPRASREVPVHQRVHNALDAAGADFSAMRDLGNGSLEVTFRFAGERFICVVDAETLQVYDAGICLSGADRMVNLDSLPSVIREAVDTGQLVITRH